MENLFIVFFSSDETGVEICNFVNTVDGNHGGVVGGRGFTGLGSSNLAGRITMLSPFWRTV